MEGEGGPAPKQQQQLFFDNVSPATRLLEKRRQMYEVQDALDNQKARFEKDELQFRKKEEQLRAKDLQLQHQLFRFNKFLQDNEAKRRRAETRAAEEAAQIKQREDEIFDLDKQLKESDLQCRTLEDEVTKNQKYEEFLERVKDTCDEYSEIQDLVTRYDTLESANKDLMKLQTDSESKIEQLRTNFQNHRKDQEMEILAFTNRIATLSGELDEASRARVNYEHQVDEATREDSQHSLHFGQIMMSVENLFLRCTSKRKSIQHATTPADDEITKGKEGEDEENEDSFKNKQQTAIKQLKVIHAYLRDFKDITDTLKREQRSNPQNRQKQQAAAMAVEKPTEPTITVHTEPRGERTSHASGSLQNTRELSKAGREMSGGVGGGDTAS